MTWIIVKQGTTYTVVGGNMVKPEASLATESVRDSLSVISSFEMQHSVYLKIYADAGAPSRTWPLGSHEMFRSVLDAPVRKIVAIAWE